jgi:hypothetical protein
MDDETFVPLPEECLEQDLETLQENDLPVHDTVAGLLTVHALQQEEQEKDDPTTIA